MMADFVFVGDAIAAMKLDRLTGNKLPGLADVEACQRYCPAALSGGGVDTGEREIKDRARLMRGHEHVGHDVLQGLERADRLTELLALLEIGRTDFQLGFH